MRWLLWGACLVPFIHDILHAAWYPIGPCYIETHLYNDCLMQKRCNPSVIAMELCLYCIKPFMFNNISELALHINWHFKFIWKKYLWGISHYVFLNFMTNGGLALNDNFFFLRLQRTCCDKHLLQRTEYMAFLYQTQDKPEVLKARTLCWWLCVLFVFSIEQKEHNDNHKSTYVYTYNIGITALPLIEGILPKGPYPPCLRMADRALLAGYPRHMVTHCDLMMRQ